MPDNKEISALTTAEQTSNNDLFETSIPNAMTDSGYVSRKQSVTMLEQQMLGNTQYNTELPNFSAGNRTIFKALEEARSSGGGGSANLTELTQAEYDALEQAGQLVEDMMYFITDANGDGSQFQPIIYSTTEREIGVWKDGRPLYQKTYVTNMQSGSQTCDIAFTDITGLDSIVDLKGLFAEQVPFDLSGCCYGTDYSKIWVKALSQYAEYGYVDSAGIRVYRQSTGTYSPTPEVVVTIRYTKSTDTAGSGTWTPQGVPTHHYSTTEQIIGTWFDGSTLYERTFDLSNTTLANEQWTLNLLGTYGTGIVIRKFDWYFAINSAIFPYPYFRSANEYMTASTVDTMDDVQVRPNIGGVTITGGYMIVQYTKSSS